MAILHNSVKALFLIFFMSESLASNYFDRPQFQPQARSDLKFLETWDPYFGMYSNYNPNEYAEILEGYVRANRYDKAKDFYLKAIEYLDNTIKTSLSDKDRVKYWNSLSDNDRVKYLKDFHQFIRLQRMMYQYSDNFIFFDSDEYDLDVIQITVLLSTATYFSYSSTEHSKTLFEYVKKLYMFYQNFYEKKLRDIRFPVMFQKKIGEINEKKNRLTRNFKSYFPRLLSSDQTKASPKMDVMPSRAPLQDIINTKNAPVKKIRKTRVAIDQRSMYKRQVQSPCRSVAGSVERF